MRSSAILAAFLLVACSGNPGPGEAGYPFNASGKYAFNIPEDGLSGSAELRTAPGGAVTGTYSLASSVSVTGTIKGTIVGDRLVFEMPFTVAESMCTGTAKGTGTVARGTQTITGTIAVTEECANPGSRTFRLTR